MEISHDFSRFIQTDFSETLGIILGKTPGETLAYYLQFPEPPKDPETLSKRLRGAVGDGAVVIERISVKMLYQRLKLPYLDDESSFDFARYVERAIGGTTKPRANEKVRGILKTLLSSRTKGELLVLFHKNPGLSDTLEGVARRIGRTSPEIESDVKDFVHEGLLVSKKLGDREMITLDHTRDKEIQTLLEEYFRALDRD